MIQRFVRSIVAAAIVVALVPALALAGTTGGVTGRVVDASTQASLAGVTVTISSPSQVATVVTDADGKYAFLSLVPDTYTITLARSGYSPVSQPGLSIFADQTQTVNFSMTSALKTIAKTSSRASSDLVKSGATGDVYSLNAANAQAAGSLVGPGGLSNAYGAIASVPGVSIDAGEQGWFQTVHIRGGDIDQVGYELDGIPVNRVYDNAPMTMLSSLGQQELQVYTGGTPASADAQGISGYINQVVKTGTFPGFADSTVSIGGPAFYHQASVEVGGSTPDRRFSYYAGIGAADQDYRYIDGSNGASIPNSFFYPINAVDPTSFAPGAANPTVYVGSNGLTNLFASGNAYGIASSQQRDDILNLHFALPHKNNGMRDDVQFLYLTSEVWAQYYSSQNDLGTSLVNQLGQNTWDDSHVYTGPSFQAPVAGDVSTYLFPSSPTQRQFGGPLPAAQRDANDNGVAVEKLQYQHTINSNSFVRAYGYMLYSNWFINGPNTAAQPFYGAELADYEIPDHTYGFNLSYTNQLSDKHLLMATYGYTGSNLQRYYVGFIHTNYGIANFVGNDNNCYDPGSGAQVACYGQTQGTINQVASGTLPASTMPAGSPGALHAAQWLVTNNTFNAAINQVHTRFSGFSVSDQWRPNDRMNFNIGVRAEDFEYLYGDTGASDPARAFWFTHYNQEFCAVPGQAPQFNGLGACPAGSSPVNLSNTGGGSNSTAARLEPRLGFTYMLNPLTVIRGSFGIYARPPNSSWVQYNVTQADLPTYLGSHFYAFGFNTPEHAIRPDTSYNYDLSLEKRLKGTDWSIKLTPFYRSTRDQLQNFYIDPQGGLESGLNVGHQVSSGVEVAIQKGDMAHNGLSGQLSYTYTRSRIRYQNFTGTSTNVIDQLNGYIQQYNSYTFQCAGKESTAQCGGGAFAANGAPTFLNATGTGTNVVVNNPYYCTTTSAACPYSAQPLLDRNAYYPTYDVIPGPSAGTNGYAVPSVATLILNYRTDKFAITPSLSYSSGAEYGAPTVWPGYVPQSCPKTLGGSANADPASCTDNGGLSLFIPDPYNNNQYDTRGQFKEPWRVSDSLGFSYTVSPKATAHLTFTNLIDHCGQRGYAWDNPNVCTYGALPSGVLASAGNFYPNSFSATAPPQLQYPYSFWLNNNNTGFVGVTIPMEVNFSLDLKL